MASFKLKDKNGVETTYNKSGVKIPNASGTGYVIFSEGVPNTYTVSFSVDGTIISALSVPQGKSMSNAYSPTKSGYVFVGWATTSGAIQPNVDFPYTPTENVTLYAVFNTVVQYKSTITGIGASSTSSVNFSTNSNLQTWTPEEVTIGNDIFVKFPTFYRKVTATSSGQITGEIISSWKEDSNFVPYSCFIDESGNVLPYILVGKYMMSSTTTANSVNATYKTMTVDAGRNLARLKGTGYQLYDWQIHKLIQDLAIAQKRTMDTNSGSGFDTLLNIAHQKNSLWIDGVAKSYDEKWVFSYKPSQYANSPDSNTVGYNMASYTPPQASGNITKLGYDVNHPFFAYPATASGSSYTSYYYDGYFYGAGSHPVICYVGYTNVNYGVFFCGVYYDWSGTFGVRLCYRPL